MNGQILTQEIITQFKRYLQSEEKSENTVLKYIRDVKAFSEFTGCNGAVKKQSRKKELQVYEKR